MYEYVRWERKLSSSLGNQQKINFPHLVLYPTSAADVFDGFWSHRAAKFTGFFKACICELVAQFTPIFIKGASPVPLKRSTYGIPVCNSTNLHIHILCRYTFQIRDN